MSATCTTTEAGSTSVLITVQDPTVVQLAHTQRSSFPLELVVKDKQEVLKACSILTYFRFH